MFAKFAAGPTGYLGDKSRSLQLACGFTQAYVTESSVNSGLLGFFFRSFPSVTLVTLSCSKKILSRRRL